MKRSRFTEEQIVGILKEASPLVEKGKWELLATVKKVLRAPQARSKQ